MVFFSYNGDYSYHKKKKKMPKTEFQFNNKLTTKNVYDICCPYTDGYFISLFYDTS